jgi:hypothetical protein
MTHHSSGSDRVGHGEASLGEAQAANPPDDPEMLRDDAVPLDTDVEYEGDGPRPPAERGNEDPAPNAP